MQGQGDNSIMMPRGGVKSEEYYVKSRCIMLRKNGRRKRAAKGVSKGISDQEKGGGLRYPSK